MFRAKRASGMSAGHLTSPICRDMQYTGIWRRRGNLYDIKKRLSTHKKIRGFLRRCPLSHLLIGQPITAGSWPILRHFAKICRDYFLRRGRERQLEQQAAARRYVNCCGPPARLCGRNKHEHPITPPPPYSTTTTRYKLCVFKCFHRPHNEAAGSSAV
ncbi:hypothetical protein J6590_082483 [Homalodisca vitripennis]|nr:hypothetical protein J6590_082483 [Homalodisca vitripennis]